MDFYNLDHRRQAPEPNLDPPDDVNYYDADAFARDVYREELSARNKFDAFNSCHEGLAVLLEEVEELKVLVFNKDRTSSAKVAMREECIQIATMAFCFINELLS